MDNVNSPEHYKLGNVEAIDVIRSILTPEQFKGLCVGSALQYLMRFNRKNGDQDILKAEWYLKEIGGILKCE